MTDRETIEPNNGDIAATSLSDGELSNVRWGSWERRRRCFARGEDQEASASKLKFEPLECGLAPTGSVVHLPKIGGKMAVNERDVLIKIADAIEAASNANVGRNPLMQTVTPWLPRRDCETLADVALHAIKDAGCVIWQYDTDDAGPRGK